MSRSNTASSPPYPALSRERDEEQNPSPASGSGAQPPPDEGKRVRRRPGRRCDNGGARLADRPWCSDKDSAGDERPPHSDRSSPRPERARTITMIFGALAQATAVASLAPSLSGCGRPPFGDAEGVGESARAGGTSTAPGFPWPGAQWLALLCASCRVLRTASRLNEAGFWRGGNAANASICLATMACIA